MDEDNIIIYDTVDSTNTKIKELLYLEDIPEFTVVAALFQTTGKGQGGNSWESERGENLTFSVLLMPHFLEPSQQFYLSKIVSLAINDTLTSYRIKSKIKWPNDIYVGDKKIAGILIENSIIGSKLSESFVGIGLNVNQEVFVSDAPNPVSMFNILGKVTFHEDLLEVLLISIDVAYEMLKAGEFEILDKMYMKHLYRSEGMHMYRDSEGEFMAEIMDVEPTGRLVLEDENGKVRRYTFKEVEFVLG